MNWFYFTFFLTVVGPVLYQVTQKMTPTHVNPFVSLTISYITALVLCIAGIFLRPPAEGIRESFHSLNWTSVILGITLVIVEVGFMLVYRSGWSLTSLNLASTAAGTVLLVTLGIILFHEPVSLQKLAGIALCLVGLALVGRG